MSGFGFLASGTSLVMQQDALPYMSPQAIEDAALEIDKIVDMFLPGMPYWRLRLCVLLSMVSGDPFLPLDGHQVQHNPHHFLPLFPLSLRSFIDIALSCTANI